MFCFKALYCGILLWASLILAQVTTNLTDPCSAPDGLFEVYVSDQEDIDLIADCVILNSNLTIYTNLTLSLPNLVTIQGDVTVTEPTPYVEGKLWDRQLQELDRTLLSISFPRLETIRGRLDIRRTTLGTLELPSLSTVDYIGLGTPNLTTWTGTNTLRTIDQIRMSQHNISKLEFRNLVNISDLYVAFENPSTVYLNGTLSNRTRGADVWMNSISDVSVTSDLQNTYNATFTFRGCQNITLNAQNLGRLQISDSPKLEHLSVPFLTHVSNASESDTYDDGRSWIGGTGRIVIMDNERLQDINFPSLVSVDDELVVLRNPLLTSFGEGFPALINVGRIIEVEGNMTSFHLPNPVTVGLYVRVNSTVETFDCNTVTQNFPNGTAIICRPYNYTISTSSPERHKAKLSYPAKIGLGVGIAVFFVLSLGLGCGFCLWRSHRHPDRSGRAATISSNLMRLWAKESFQKKPPSYPLQDFQRRDEPLPSYQPRPSSTATTLAPDANDVSRPGTGTRPPQNLGVAASSSRPVSPVSAVSVLPPSPAQLSSRRDPSTLPPDYRP